MKLQINVSDDFGAFTEKLVETYKAALPEDLKKYTPRGPNALIPLALVNMAKELNQDVPPAIMNEANETIARKPGPKKKDDRQLAFDDGPGVWFSIAALTSGGLLIQFGEHELPLFGCMSETSVAASAMAKGWGLIPEKNAGGLCGLRFIPPGAPLYTEQSKPPAPNVTDVGVFISEEQIQSGPIAILTNGRVVPRKVPDDGLGRDVIRFQRAELDAAHEGLSDDERTTRLRQQTDKSFRIANADAVEIGWTVRRETRRTKRGFRYIPPGTKLRCVLPEGEIEVG